MDNYPNTLKENLFSIIRSMADSPEPYVKKPNRDFTRNRKLSFETMINIFLSMGGNTICKELLESQGYNENVATTSAFVQQRGKILSSSLEYLFHEFTKSFATPITFCGYRIVADDGSDLHIATDPSNPDTYFQNTPDSKGFNLLHLNALYDLCNKVYVDALIQPSRLTNEGKALTDMVDRSNITEKVILLADRGYECYNNFAHVEKKGWNYVFRVKDLGSNGILSGLSPFLPKTGEFDVSIQRILTRSKSKEVKAHPETYRILYHDAPFDFMDKQNMFYPISYRVVRFKITEDTYETLITNLDRADFSPMELKALYNMRWGIETSFRHLKHTIGLVNFHAKKQEYITQEIFARLITYNFSEMITSHVIISHGHTKYIYQVNFTVAVDVCKKFLRLLGNILPSTVEALIRNHTTPVRPGRSWPRNVRPQTNVSFIYRVA